MLSLVYSSNSKGRNMQLKTRCDKISVQVVVTQYNDQGQPIAEEVAQPLVLFRASTPDVWAHIDSLLSKPRG